MELIKLNIDGKEVEVSSGTTVLNAAEQVGIHIPRFCYDKELSSCGACRICVVEIEGMHNLAASCVTAVSPGMVVKTESPAVVEARKIVLELMLADHPQDCMTCEKMGDCKLAEYCYRYGVKKSSFAGAQHSYAVDDSNPLSFGT